MNHHPETPELDLDLLKAPNDDFANPGDVIDSSHGGDGVDRYAYSSLMAALVTPAIRSPLSFIKIANGHEGRRGYDLGELYAFLKACLKGTTTT